MIATIILDNLSARCRIGVTQKERKHPQRIVIQCCVSYDIAKAAESDDISQALNYVLLRDSVSRFLQGYECKLLERLLGDLRMHIKQSFSGVTHLEISLRKKRFTTPSYTLSGDWSEK